MTKQKNAKQFWINHISSFEQSGLSQSEYCRRMKLNPKSFSAQKSMISKSSFTSGPFIQIPLKSKNRREDVVIKLSNGMELKFEDLPDPVWFSKVIQSMGASDAIH